jgi:metallophosphoesterase superfamily enzyme
LTDDSYFQWLIAVIEEHKPHVIVNLGDWYEGKAAKRWPSWSDETWSLNEEHRMVSDQALAIRAAAPDARLVWLYGNHDDNLFGMQPERIKDDLRESVQWSENRLAAVALDGWEVVRKYGERIRLRIGPITFQHGVDLNVNGEKDAGYYHGTPYGLYVCGHTHRPVRVTRAQERKTYLPYWYANTGCGANWERMHYVDRAKTRMWGRGAVVGECSGADQRRTAFASKQWDAELKVHSLAAGETL